MWLLEQLQVYIIQYQLGYVYLFTKLTENIMQAR